MSSEGAAKCAQIDDVFARDRCASEEIDRIEGQLKVIRDRIAGLGTQIRALDQKPTGAATQGAEINQVMEQQRAGEGEKEARLVRGKLHILGIRIRDAQQGGKLEIVEELREQKKQLERVEKIPKLVKEKQREMRKVDTNIRAEGVVPQNKRSEQAVANLAHLKTERAKLTDEIAALEDEKARITGELLSNTETDAHSEHAALTQQMNEVKGGIDNIAAGITDTRAQLTARKTMRDTEAAKASKAPEDSASEGADTLARRLRKTAAAVSPEDLEKAQREIDELEARLKQQMAERDALHTRFLDLDRSRAELAKLLGMQEDDAKARAARRRVLEGQKSALEEEQSALEAQKTEVANYLLTTIPYAGRWTVVATAVIEHTERWIRMLNLARWGGRYADAIAAVGDKAKRAGEVADRLGATLGVLPKTEGSADPSGTEGEAIVALLQERLDDVRKQIAAMQTGKGAHAMEMRGGALYDPPIEALVEAVRASRGAWRWAAEEYMRGDYAAGDPCSFDDEVLAHVVDAADAAGTDCPVVRFPMVGTVRIGNGETSTEVHGAWPLHWALVSPAVCDAVQHPGTKHRGTTATAPATPGESWTLSIQHKDAPTDPAHAIPLLFLGMVVSAGALLQLRLRVAKMRPADIAAVLGNGDPKSVDPHYSAELLVLAMGSGYRARDLAVANLITWPARVRDMQIQLHTALGAQTMESHFRSIAGGKVPTPRGDPFGTADIARQWLGGSASPRVLPLEASPRLTPNSLARVHALRTEAGERIIDRHELDLHAVWAPHAFFADYAHEIPPAPLESVVRRCAAEKYVARGVADSPVKAVERKYSSTLATLVRTVCASAPPRRLPDEALALGREDFDTLCIAALACAVRAVHDVQGRQKLGDYVHEQIDARRAEIRRVQEWIRGRVGQTSDDLSAALAQLCLSIRTATVRADPRPVFMFGAHEDAHVALRKALLRNLGAAHRFLTAPPGALAQRMKNISAAIEGLHYAARAAHVTVPQTVVEFFGVPSAVREPVMVPAPDLAPARVINACDAWKFADELGPSAAFGYIKIGNNYKLHGSGGPHIAAAILSEARCFARWEAVFKRPGHGADTGALWDLAEVLGKLPDPVPVLDAEQDKVEITRRYGVYRAFLEAWDIGALKTARALPGSSIEKDEISTHVAALVTADLVAAEGHKLLDPSTHAPPILGIKAEKFRGTIDAGTARLLEAFAAKVAWGGASPRGPFGDALSMFGIQPAQGNVIRIIPGVQALRLVNLFSVETSEVRTRWLGRLADIVRGLEVVVHSAVDGKDELAAKKFEAVSQEWNSAMQQLRKHYTGVQPLETSEGAGLIDPDAYADYVNILGRLDAVLDAYVTGVIRRRTADNDSLVEALQREWAKVQAAHAARVVELQEQPFAGAVATHGTALPQMRRAPPKNESRVGRIARRTARVSARLLEEEPPRAAQETEEEEEKPEEEKEKKILLPSSAARALQAELQAEITATAGAYERLFQGFGSAGAAKDAPYVPELLYVLEAICSGANVSEWTEGLKKIADTMDGIVPGKQSLDAWRDAQVALRAHVHRAVELLETPLGDDAQCTQEQVRESTGYKDMIAAARVLDTARTAWLAWRREFVRQERLGESRRQGTAQTGKASESETARWLQKWFPRDPAKRAERAAEMQTAMADIRQIGRRMQTVAGIQQRYETAVQPTYEALLAANTKCTELLDVLARLPGRIPPYAPDPVGVANTETRELMRTVRDALHKVARATRADTEPPAFAARIAPAGHPDPVLVVFPQPGRELRSNTLDNTVAHAMFARGVYFRVASDLAGRGLPLFTDRSLRQVRAAIGVVQGSHPIEPASIGKHLNMLKFLQEHTRVNAEIRQCAQDLGAVLVVPPEPTVEANLGAQAWMVAQAATQAMRFIGFRGTAPGRAYGAPRKGLRAESKVLYARYASADGFPDNAKRIEKLAEAARDVDGRPRPGLHISSAAVLWQLDVQTAEFGRMCALFPKLTRATHAPIPETATKAFRHAARVLGERYAQNAQNAEGPDTSDDELVPVVLDGAEIAGVFRLRAGARQRPPGNPHMDAGYPYWKTGGAFVLEDLDTYVREAARAQSSLSIMRGSGALVTNGVRMPARWALGPALSAASRLRTAALHELEVSGVPRLAFARELARRGIVVPSDGDAAYEQWLHAAWRDAIAGRGETDSGVPFLAIAPPGGEQWTHNNKFVELALPPLHGSGGVQTVVAGYTVVRLP